MAGSVIVGTKIQMPLSFVAEAQQMRKIFEQLKKSTSIDLSSTLGKKFTKTLEQMEKQLSKYETIALSPELDAQALNKAKASFDKFYEYVASIGKSVDYANVFDFNLNAGDLAQLNNYIEALRNLNNEMNTLRKNGTKVSAEKGLTNLGQTDLLNRARAASQHFDSSRTAGANANALSAEASAARDQLATLEIRQQALADEATNLATTSGEITRRLRLAREQLARTENIINRGNFLKQYEGLDTKVLQTKGGQMRGQTGVLSEIMAPFEKNAVGNRIAESNLLGAESILKYLGFDANTIANLLTQQLPDIRAAIARQLQITEGSTDPLTGEAYRRLNNVRTRSRAYMRNQATETVYNRVAGERLQVSGIERELLDSDRAIQANADSTNETREAIQETRALIAELDEVSAALQRFQEALTETEITALQSRIDATREQQKEGQQRIRGKYAQPIKEEAGRDHNDDSMFAASAEDINNQKLAEQEAQQFTDNLKTSIKHWMSAQQVINLVKDGIRQAWTDIQGLDKAMTNIAVVTDMTTGDLWGKINEYMAIAQQYGVSTQGVYEVSQLYYQQGLTTNEVMKATTETLKMARIAGMDYAEAADAMTVAIRGFKMEMSDAQTVTDVYSKVAAVTASDTQELAIAMSKTASSAESVGSSFENTTAMLAVMIETTRESAQNLGSALKSIISR